LIERNVLSRSLSRPTRLLIHLQGSTLLKDTRGDRLGRTLALIGLDIYFSHQ